MAWIRHDSHGATVIKNQQALGPESPLETDDDGYAEVHDDDAAELLAAIDAHVSESGGPGGGESADGPMESPAEALARDHWQTTANAIEAGEADDYLDELAELDDRPSVQAAIDERRG